MIAAKGASVLDADVVVHELERRGQPVWQAIVDHFGPGLLLPSGELDRAALGRLVFSDSQALADLEKLVHPAVRQEMRRRIAEEPAGRILCVDAIKLIESGMAAACDSVWVVTASAEERARRLQRDRGLNEDVAWQRIQAQTPQEEKLPLAAVVIDNNGLLAATQSQVNEAWERTVAPWLAGGSLA